MNDEWGRVVWRGRIEILRVHLKLCADIAGKDTPVARQAESGIARADEFLADDCPSAFTANAEKEQANGRT
jgi:hypothetical protein